MVRALAAAALLGGCLSYVNTDNFLIIMNLMELLQVFEEADEEGKMGFVNFKRVVWHESFLKLLELVVQYSKTGYAHQCFDMIIRWLFPILLILSADYEEQYVLVFSVLIYTSLVQTSHILFVDV